MRAFPRQQSTIDQLLRDRLVARHLTQLAVLVEVAATVANLQHVQPRPYHNAKRQRRRHLASIKSLRRFVAHCLMRIDCRRAQRVHELVIFDRTYCVIAAQCRRHVAHDRFGRESARLTPSGAATNAVGHQQDRRQPLPRGHQRSRIRQTGPVHHQLRVHRRQHEMILIFLPDEPDVGQPKHVEFIVVRSRRVHVWIVAQRLFSGHFCARYTRNRSTRVRPGDRLSELHLRLHEGGVGSLDAAVPL